MDTTRIRLGPGAGHHPDRALPAPLPAAAALPAEVPAAETLAAVLDHHAHARGADACAYLIDPEGAIDRFSWAEMVALAERLARGLADRGVSAGARVVIALPTSAELLGCFLGCQLLGALPCLVEPASLGRGLPPWIERLTPKLRLLEPVLLVTPGTAAGPIAAALAGRPVRVDAVEALPADGRVTWHAGSAGDAAFLQFTSGTTSLPRAVTCSHRALLANVRGLGAQGRWRRDDLMVGWLPLFHDMGLVATTLSALCHGLPVALLSPISFLLRPARWLWALHAMRGSLSFAPNFAYQLCVKRLSDPDLEGLDLSSFRRAHNAAEYVHPATLRDFAQRFAPYGLSPTALAPSYGMAEMVVGVSTHEPGQPVVVDCIGRDQLSRRGRAVPCPPGSPDAMEVVHVGPVFAGHEVRIVGDDGLPVADRTQGEIELRGPSLFSGYFADEVATRQVLHDGWLRTGDLGYLADGKLFISGRCKELIIRGGENYHPHLMERAAALVAGVREGGVAAVGVPNPQSGTEDLVIVYETLETAPARLGEISRQIEDAVRSATGLRPDRVLPVAPRSIPKTSSGKVKRGVLRQNLAERAPLVSSPQAPARGSLYG
jgi:fatty-acyl-CoA synthase